jgi:carbamate kinase
MRIVVALGGNALLERGERPDELLQRHHVVRAARALARLAHEHELVVCHGNGPQVGILAVESSADGALSQPYGLDTLVAQTQGMIGYWLAPRLGWSMAREGAGWRRVVASPSLGTSSRSRLCTPSSRVTRS